MPTATVTSKGQITIPAEVRAALGLRAGSRVQFVQLDDGKYEIVPASRSVSSLAGFLAPAPRVLSVEEMDEAVAASLAPEQDAR
jgi:AbrB family looped-hinge helix DNA binding protein